MTTTSDTTATLTTYVGTANALPTTFALYDPNVGNYAFIANTEYVTAEYIGDLDTASLFSLNATGALFDKFNRIGNTDTHTEPSPVFFGGTFPPFNLITCTVVRNADNTCSLPCTSHDGAWNVESIQNEGNPNVWNLGSDSGVSGVFVPQVFG